MLCDRRTVFLTVPQFSTKKLVLSSYIDCVDVKKGERPLRQSTPLLPSSERWVSTV